MNQVQAVPAPETVPIVVKVETPRSIYWPQVAVDGFIAILAAGLGMWAALMIDRNQRERAEQERAKNAALEAIRHEERLKAEEEARKIQVRQKRQAALKPLLEKLAFLENKADEFLALLKDGQRNVSLPGTQVQFILSEADKLLIGTLQIPGRPDFYNELVDYCERIRGGTVINMAVLSDFDKAMFSVVEKGAGALNDAVFFIRAELRHYEHLDANQLP